MEDKERVKSILAIALWAIAAFLVGVFCVLGCFAFELHAFSFAFGFLAVAVLICAFVLALYNIVGGTQGKNKVMNIAALVLCILSILGLTFCFFVFTVVSAVLA